MRNDTDNTLWIDRALLRLLPDIFFHPVWIYFAAEPALLAPGLIESLLCTVEDLQAQNEWLCACQVSLMCAAQQSCAGDEDQALYNVQRALALAQAHELREMTWWAAWGASAICAQQGRFLQSAEYLNYLRLQLVQHGEWVLADVVDLIQQAVLQRASSPDTSSANLLNVDAALDVEHLLRWGVPLPVSMLGGTHLTSDRSLRSHLRFGELNRSWQNFKLWLKGERRLKRVQTQTPQLPRALPDQSTPLLVMAPAALPPIEEVAPATNSTPLVSLTAHLLGNFGVAVNDRAADEWPGGKSRAVLKYLLAHRDRPVPREVLMDVFWPEAAPESARNNLNVTLHSLRHVLKNLTHLPLIPFEDGAYRLNPEVAIWVDVEEFECHYQAGRRLEAAGQVAAGAHEYEVAVDLYQGDFLEDDPYEEWAVLPRERLRVAYLEALDRLSQIYFDRQQVAACVALCQKILQVDACREDAHCRLMRCYNRQGQRHLALRQYQVCVETLRVELNVDPDSTTAQLAERIRRHEAV